MCVLCVCLCALIGGQSEGWGATCTLLESAHTHINACRGFTLGKQTKTRVKAWSAASLAPRQCVFSPQHKLKRQLLPKPILKCYKSRGSFISHTSALFAIWCHVSAHTNCLCVCFFFNSVLFKSHLCQSATQTKITLTRLFCVSPAGVMMPHASNSCFLLRACTCVWACVSLSVCARGDIEQTVAFGWMCKWWLISIKLRKAAVTTFIASLCIHFTLTDFRSHPNINKH